MKFKYIFYFVLCFVVAVVALTFLLPKAQVAVAAPAGWWQIQSIDTMKYSRDTAGEALTKPSFDKTIDLQVGEVARTGANYVAIGTPYDDQFLPVLKRWVAAARRYNLHVWFRGNFSGWEGWFGYANITRDDHIKKLDTFITKNPDLFQDGDMFTSCPECENGGPGDPRQNGDVTGHRQFLITEYQRANDDFRSIGKNVSVGYDSMNYDVASLVMDKATTQALGGIVTIDHYVNSPDKLIQNIRDLANNSGGKIFLGEFGVPIPDINGNMSDSEQAVWIQNALSKLIDEKEVIGLNYWVGVGGSTALWHEDGSAKEAVGVVTSFFSPTVTQGTVYNQFHVPVSDVTVSSVYKDVTTNAQGDFTISLAPSDTTLHAAKSGYVPLDYMVSSTAGPVALTIQKTNVSFLEEMVYRLIGLFHR